MSKKHKATIVGIVSTLIITAATAHAAQIQMIPPVDFAGAPCNSSNGTGGVLQWDGNTAITCVPGASGDVNGNFSVNGYIRPGSSQVQSGLTCADEGAIGYDNVSSTHQLVVCDTTLHWSAMTGGPAGTLCGYAAATCGFGSTPNLQVTSTSCNGSAISFECGKFVSGYDYYVARAIGGCPSGYNLTPLFLVPLDGAIDRSSYSCVKE